MIRARWSTALRNWIRAYRGTMKKPPKRPSAKRSTRTRHVPARASRQEQGRREGDVDAEECESDRTEGHQTDFHLAGREPFAEQRADADTNGKHRQQQGHRSLAAAEHEAGVRWELRQEHGAIEPEPGNAEDRQEDGAVLAREADVAPGL